MDIPALKEKQNASLLEKGKFFQVKVGDTVSIDGSVSVPDLPVGSEIHTHLLPDGRKGYTIFQRRTLDGVVQTKAVSGGSGGKNFDWINGITISYG